MKAHLTSIALVVLAGVTLAGCRQPAEDADERAGFAVRDVFECLPDITLIDQHGQKVSLSSLRGIRAIAASTSGS
jgi:cytochrome oxidase Cu insertion factor (SCO1/SenC/PrrC family)